MNENVTFFQREKNTACLVAARFLETDLQILIIGVFPKQLKRNYFPQWQM